MSYIVHFQHTQAIPRFFLLPNGHYKMFHEKIGGKKLKKLFFKEQ